MTSTIACVQARTALPALAATLAAAALLLVPAARAEHVAVVIVPGMTEATFAGRGAIGLYLPGRAGEAGRHGAIRALGIDRLTAPACASRRPCPIEILVGLPAPGDHRNRPYPIAVVGAGYRGLLTSSSTRIPGLVAAGDVERTVRALERGDRPVLRARPDPDATDEVTKLERRLIRNRGTRIPGEFLVAAVVFFGSLLALGLRSRFMARAALLASPAVLAMSLVVSAAGVSRAWLAVLLVALTAVGASLVAATRPRLLAPAFAGVLLSYLVVMSAWPEVNSFAVVGPHPERAGRYYGLTNLTSTILLAVSLQLGALLGLRSLVLLAPVALVTIGWSKAGADGGGLVVAALALSVLALRLHGERLTPRAVALAAAAAIALGLALVGIDAATGGSSHVTRAIGDGPGALLGDLGQRLHVGASHVADTWYAAAIVAIALGAVVVLARLGPRFPVGDALIAGLVVSLLVNDTPPDVAAVAALSYGVFWTWERVRLTSRRG